MFEAESIPVLEPDGSRAAAVPSEAEDTLLLVIGADAEQCAHVRRAFMRSHPEWRMAIHGDGIAGLQLLEVCRAPTRVVVVLDLAMGGEQDGHAVLRRLKSDPRWSCIPVFVLSGSRVADDIRVCYEAGCNAVMDKGCRVDGRSAAVEGLAAFLQIMQIAPIAQADAPQH